MGYDWPVGKKISITPVLNYNRRSLGHVKNQLVTIANREHRVLDLGIALAYR